MGPLTKRCGHCRQHKALSNFGRDRGRQDGLNPRCKSCVNTKTEAQRKAARQRAAQWVTEHPEEAREHNRAYKKRLQQNQTNVWLFREAKRRARQLNVEFDITEDDVVVPDKCPVFGIPFGTLTGKHALDAPSLDRLDPQKGYIRGNIHVISWRANRLKYNGSLEDFRRLVAWMESVS